VAIDPSPKPVFIDDEGRKQQESYLRVGKFYEFLEDVNEN
jgi:hypothetical protein